MNSVYLFRLGCATVYFAWYDLWIGGYIDRH